MHRLFEPLNGFDSTSRTLNLIEVIILSAILQSRLIRWIIHGSFILNKNHTPSDLTRLSFLKNAISMKVYLEQYKIFNEASSYEYL